MHRVPIRKVEIALQARMLAKNGEQMTKGETLWVSLKEKLHWLLVATAALALRRPSWFTVVGFVTFRRIAELMRIYVLLGGHVAEEMIFGDISTGARRTIFKKRPRLLVP